ncbi:unnamed protein product [Rotaria sordida]|uniref:Uncharacterized protein n=1 Tax=Rotaria sordida TaxID=392033 RepID=A0A820FR04_9BILA|nr:unnamed protein product [Rotaria sordida]CAF4265575.1 unnamed protein product [Rotaria sordida]
MSIMDKYPLLETLFELHKRVHYVDKMLSTLHFVFISEKLFKIKHTNGQINRLIDWHDADKGLGKFEIIYMDEISEIRCYGDIDNEKFDMLFVSVNHDFPIALKKGDYLEDNGEPDKIL